MAAVWERQGAQAVRDGIGVTASALGHHMTWKLGENANRKGHAYSWEGVCTHCGAEATAGSGYSSCAGILDARAARCSGPGTAILTEIETRRFAEVVAASWLGSERD